MANLRTRLKQLEQITRSAELEPVIRQPGESAEAWYRRLCDVGPVKTVETYPVNISPEEAYRRVWGER